MASQSSLHALFAHNHRFSPQPYFQDIQRGRVVDKAGLRDWVWIYVHVLGAARADKNIAGSFGVHDPYLVFNPGKIYLI